MSDEPPEDIDFEEEINLKNLSTEKLKEIYRYSRYLSQSIASLDDGLFYIEELDTTSEDLKTLEEEVRGVLLDRMGDEFRDWKGTELYNELKEIQSLSDEEAWDEHWSELI